MFRKRAIRTAMLAAVTVAVSARLGWGYTPQSPEVQEMVRRGIAYIEKNHGNNGLDKELGGFAVSAMACYMHTGDANHPLVQAALREIRTGIQNGLPHTGHANYSLGLALILLGTIDAAQFRPEVEALLAEVYRRQMANGPWSYPENKTGDTSQTQFACLGMWMAHRQGIEVRIPAVAKVTNWLLRTQAPDGGFGYQGNDPGTFTRIPQERMTESMGVAGAGTLYVLGELLGFIDDPKTARLKSRLPPAIRPVIKETTVVTEEVDRGRWAQAVKDADAWVARKAGVENLYNGVPTHQYYYMYTVERYWAFRELASGVREAEPSWYNQGVRYLQQKMAPDGSWTSTNGPTIGTAFAVLFLLRSSQATVTRIQIERGRLTGGKGLKSDLSTARVDARGQVIVASPEKSVEELLKLLEDPKAPQSEYVDDVPEKLTLPTDPRERELQLSRLRRLVVNGSFQARLTAAKTLGTIRDLSSAPALIYALSDPDYRVVRAAENALRFMSRKPEGFGFEVGEARPEKHLYQQAQRNWTNWLLSVKPDAELLE